MLINQECKVAVFLRGMGPNEVRCRISKFQQSKHRAEASKQQLIIVDSCLDGQSKTLDHRFNGECKIVLGVTKFMHMWIS